MIAELAVAARIENGHCPCCGCDYCPNDCRDLCCKAASGLEQPTVSSGPTRANHLAARIVEAGATNQPILGLLAQYRKAVEAEARATAEAQLLAAEQRSPAHATVQANIDLTNDLIASEAQVAELRAALGPLLRARHETAHNGDIYRGGNYETCPLCQPVRDLLPATHASSRFLDLDALLRVHDELIAAATARLDPHHYDHAAVARLIRAVDAASKLKEDRREPGGTRA